MCGITGFWSTNIRQYEPDRVLDVMVSAIKHRGPDDEGVWTDSDCGVFLGHRRLSVIDLSNEGRQPMLSRSGRYVISYNGEVFNYAELRRQLAAPAWRGHSDTEVMLEAFDQWGVEGAVKRFNGQFAFAVWDVRESVMILARDRLGIKPLYVGRFGDTFAFGSELKSLAAHPSFDGRIDAEAVTRFLELGYVPGALSIYAAVRKVPPGHILEMREPGAGLSSRSYWSVEDVVENRHAGGDGAEEALDGLEQRLRDAVRLRMVADVPVGAFLSGGIDSSLVVSLMMQEASGPVKTFSVGFEEESFDEAPHATRIAQYLGTDHTNLYVKAGDVFDVLNELPRMYDEPFADVSQVPTCLVSRLARQSVTVSLSGDGGDELFGGYGRYVRALRQWSKVSRIPAPLRGIFRGAAAPVAAIERSRLGRSAAYALGRLVNPGVMPGQFARQLELVGSTDALAFYAQSIRLKAGGLSNRGIRNSSRTAASTNVDIGKGLSFLESMMLTDTLAYLPDDILVKVDRASMDVALEVRVPFLDHRVVEFSWSVPEDLKMRDGQTKWLLRQLLKRYVPERMFERPKQGFAIPLGAWLRGPLRDWAESLLADRQVAAGGLVDPTSVKAIWKAHLAEKGDFEMLLFRIISLQQWLDQKGESSTNRLTAASIT